MFSFQAWPPLPNLITITPTLCERSIQADSTNPGVNQRRQREALVRNTRFNKFTAVHVKERLAQMQLDAESGISFSDDCCEKDSKPARKRAKTLKVSFAPKPTTIPKVRFIEKPTILPQLSRKEATADITWFPDIYKYGKGSKAYLTPSEILFFQKARTNTAVQNVLRRGIDKLKRDIIGAEEIADRDLTIANTEANTPCLGITLGKGQYWSRRVREMRSWRTESERKYEVEEAEMLRKHRRTKILFHMEATVLVFHQDKEPDTCGTSLLRHQTKPRRDISCEPTKIKDGAGMEWLKRKVAEMREKAKKRQTEETEKQDIEREYQNIADRLLNHETNSLLRVSSLVNDMSSAWMVALAERSRQNRDDMDNQTDRRG